MQCFRSSEASAVQRAFSHTTRQSFHVDLLERLIFSAGEVRRSAGVVCVNVMRVCWRAGFELRTVVVDTKFMIRSTLTTRL